MAGQTSKYQATNSPSKIEGAGGEYDAIAWNFPSNCIIAWWSYSP